MIFNKKLFLTPLSFIIFVLVPSFGLSAPFPATSTSVVFQNLQKSYFSDHGFKLHAQLADWKLLNPKDSQVSPEAIFISPQDFEVKMTVRTDILTAPMTLKKYVKTWSQDYPRLGFIVLGNQYFKLRGQEGYLVDLIDPQKSIQIRQAVFNHNNKSVILSCSAPQEIFTKHLKSCNSIIQTFEWVQQ